MSPWQKGVMGIGSRGLLALAVGLLSLGIGFGVGHLQIPGASKEILSVGEAAPTQVSKTALADQPNSFWKQTLPGIATLKPNLHGLKISDALLDVKPEEAQALLKALPTNLSKDDRTTWITGLLNLWAEIDPEAAFQAAQGYSELAGENQYQKQTLLGKWAEKNPDAALAYAKAEPKGSQRMSALQSVLAGIARKNPEQALDLLEAMEPSEVPEWAVGELYSKAVAKDPQGVLRRALQRKSSDENGQALTNLGTLWAMKDLTGAKAALEAIPKGRKRDQIAIGLLSVWMQNQPEAAGRFAATLIPKDADWGSPFIRNSYQFMNGYQNGETSMNFKIFTDQLPDGQVKDNLMRNWWSSRFQNNPDEAWRELMQEPAGDKRTNQIQSSLQNLSYQNTRQAFALAAQLTGEERTQAEAAIAQQWANNEPKEALAYALQSGNDKIQESVFRGLGWQLANLPKVEAEQILAQIPEKKRQQTVENYLLNLARQDSEGAYDYLQKSVPADKRANVIQQTSQMLEPTQAIWWLSHLPEDPSRAEGYRNIAAKWANNDSVAVSSWLTTLPVSPSRDAAVQGFVQQAKEYDPERATQWAATLTDASQLKSNVLDSWKRWKQQNPEAAKAWAAASSLPDEIKKELKP